MAIVSCKECKAQISNLATACPVCGYKPKKTSGCVVFVLLIGLFGILISMLNQCSSTSRTSDNQTISEANTAPIPTPTIDPVAEFAKHKISIDEIETRFKENVTHLNKYYATTDQIQQATIDLTELALLKGYYGKSKSKDERSLSQRAENLITKISQQQRELYASNLEEIFLKNGLDINVSATGKSKSQLHLKYALMSQPLVYKFQNEMQLNEQARLLGFKKITYTNGFNSSLGETWNVDLSNSN